MGINWNNLGAGLAVWGNVLKDLAEERKKKREEERMAQTLGQIMAVDTQVEQGQEPLSAQFVEETKPRQLVQDAIPDIMKNLNPEQQVQMFSALRGYKSEWADKLNNREIIDFQLQEINKAMEDPLIAEWGQSVMPLLQKNPQEKQKLVESVYNSVKDFQQAPYKARMEARAKVKTLESPEGQRLIELENERERDKELIRRNAKEPENLVKTIGDIREQNVSKVGEAHQRVDTLTEELNKFKTTDEAIQRTEELISKNFPVKSAADRDGTRLEDKFTGDQLLTATYQFWDAAGRPPEITNDMVTAGIRSLIAKNRPEGERYTPRPEFMGQINEFIREVNNTEDIGTMFHNVAYLNKQQEKSKERRFAIVREIRAMQTILENARAAEEMGMPSQAREALSAINDTPFRYLDFNSLDPEKGIMTVKEEYMGDATVLSEESGYDIDDNIFAMPSSLPVSMFAPQGEQELTFPTEVEGFEGKGFWGKLDQKGLTWNEYMANIPKGEDATADFVQAFSDEERGKERLKALQRSTQEATQQPERVEQGLKARVDNETIDTIKRVFTRELSSDREFLINAPWHSKEMAWFFVDENGEQVEKRRVFDPNDKPEFYQTIQERIIDEARHNGIPLDRVSINDPALADVKKQVDKLWEQMWKE